MVMNEDFRHRDETKVDIFVLLPPAFVGGLPEGARDGSGRGDGNRHQTVIGWGEQGYVLF